MKAGELADARDIARRELRDPRVFLRWVLSRPAHQVSLAWLRFRARRA
jgi:hypothetical protein